MPTYNPAMQKARLADVPSDVHGLISKKTAELDGVAVTEVTFQAGARWSNDLKPYAGTDLCELPHVALVTAGALRVVLGDGTWLDVRIWRSDHGRYVPKVRLDKAPREVMRQPL